MDKPLYSVEDKRRIVDSEQGKLPSEDYRSAFRRDFARLLHSPSFRRLDGKTQVFPGSEADFFRNRLTHSIEVAQVAKSIAIRFNDSEEFRDKLPGYIDTDLVEFAALAHDLGHPPFGHNGEKALDECMAEHGGFEGNAQTLRIISRLEKKRKRPDSDDYGIGRDGVDRRLGLNLTYRSLASILKYDREIPSSREKWEGVKKGYYHTERVIVKEVKNAVVGDSDVSDFKTVECSIMDLSDDIAYSTYDLEDAFKAGFLKPLDLLSADESTLADIAERVEKAIEKERDDLGMAGFADDAKEYDSAIHEGYTPERVNEILFDIFRDFILPSGPGSDLDADYEEDESKAVIQSDGNPAETKERPDGHTGKIEEIQLAKEELQEKVKKLEDKLYKASTPEYDGALASVIYEASKKVAGNSFERRKLTSRLVGGFIRATCLRVSNHHPALSRAVMEVQMRERMEVLKHYTFVSQIQSPRLQVVEYRGRDIVRKIFKALSSTGGGRLLPEDFRCLYENIDEGQRRRVICDFVAGMTDRYALDYYARITSGDAQTIFKPY